MKFDLRIEKPIKTILENLSARSGWSISKLVETIAWIGIEVKRLGGIYVVGLFGLTRPFAVANYGPRSERLTIWVNEDLRSKLKAISNENLSDALRDVLQTGMLVVDASSAVIQSPILGVKLPLTHLGDIKLEDARAINALQEIRELME